MILVLDEPTQVALFIFLFSGSFAQAAKSADRHDPKACQALEEEARSAIFNMNAAFNMNLGLEFISRADDEPHSPDYNQPAQLLSSNARKKNFIRLPKPCQMPEKTLPSKEVFLFVLAHEFSHMVFDDGRESPCYQEFLKRTYHDDKGHVHQHWDGAYDSYHANIDIFALKILSHLSVNQRNAITGTQNFLNENSEVTGCAESPCYFNTRFNEIGSVIPTSFEYGTDFIKSGFISGMPKIKNILDKNYPNSNFIDDVNQGFPDKVGRCYLPNAQEQASTSRRFFMLQKQEKGQVKGTDLNGEAVRSEP